MFRRVAPLLVAAATIAAPSPSAATDSLATPITGQPITELWPIHIEIEIVRLAEDAAPERVMLPMYRAEVPDGHTMTLESTVRTSRGRRHFALQLVARNHPGDDIELEWSLDVSEATYKAVSWSDYVLHRLQLGNRLELGERVLKIARADIVSTSGKPVRKVFSIDGEDHEIRMFARTLRG